MPIIGHVGRRSLKVRLLSLAIHLVLSAGALTMLYPFAIMLSGSVKSNVDTQTLDIIPRYFYEDATLYRKWVEAKYNEMIGEYNLCHRDKIYSFLNVDPPARPVARRFEDWNAFLAEAGNAVTLFDYSFGHANATGLKPEMSRRFIDALKSEPDVKGDIDRLNRKYGITTAEWDAIMVPVFNNLRRSSTGDFDAFTRRTLEFCGRFGQAHRNYYSLDAFFVEQTLKPNHGQRLAQINKSLGTAFRSWDEITLSRTLPEGPLREDWAFFVKKRLNLQFIEVLPPALPAYRAYLKEKYLGRIDLYNKRYDAKAAAFDEIALPAATPTSGVPFADWDYFITEVVRPECLRIRGAEFMYRDFLRRKYGTIENLVAAHEYGLRSLDELPPSSAAPQSNMVLRADWVEFVTTQADVEWVRPDSAANGAFREMLMKPFRGEKGLDLAALNKALGAAYADERDIYLPLKRPSNPALAERWVHFVREVCPKDLLVLDAKKATLRWREFIRAKYADASVLNAAYGLVPASFEQVPLPTADVDWFNYQRVRRRSFWEFVKRNYAVVLDMMMYNGRAIQNTVIYCALSILGALIVNPMAAYALSRYKPPSQYKILLFLMLTMAFPVMVLGIPSFLLTRNLGLLNTFAALVLPGIANGYSIFLLKGFFDSLPRELYESAQLDGASEWTMFWHITMATSKPILAVIALNSFQLAYANFMMAFLLCQDPKMWTMMVHLYQLQQRSAPGVVFASIVIAAIPTLLVFVFCQNIILRGIVVPTEK